MVCGPWYICGLRCWVRERPYVQLKDVVLFAENARKALFILWWQTSLSSGLVTIIGLSVTVFWITLVHCPFYVTFRRSSGKIGILCSLEWLQISLELRTNSALRTKLNRQAPATLMHNGNERKYNLPWAPHHGGSWERLVCSCKRVFYAIIGTCKLTDEVLSITLFRGAIVKCPSNNACPSWMSTLLVFRRKHLMKVSTTESAMWELKLTQLLPAEEVCPFYE